MNYEDKVAEISDQTDIPYFLCEELIKLIATRLLPRRKKITTQQFIEERPIEFFIRPLESIAWQLDKANLLERA